MTMTEIEPITDAAQVTPEDIKNGAREARIDEAHDRADQAAALNEAYQAPAITEAERYSRDSAPGWTTDTATDQQEQIANRKMRTANALGTIKAIDESRPEQSGAARVQAVDSLRAGDAEDSAALTQSRQDDLEHIAAKSGPAVLTAEVLDKDLADQGVEPKVMGEPKGLFGRLIARLAGDAKQ